MVAIRSTLDSCGGDINKAAQILGGWKDEGECLCLLHTFAQYIFIKFFTILQLILLEYNGCFNSLSNSLSSTASVEHSTL